MEVVYLSIALTIFFLYTCITMWRCGKEFSFNEAGLVLLSGFLAAVLWPLILGFGILCAPALIILRRKYERQD